MRTLSDWTFLAHSKQAQRINEAQELADLLKKRWRYVSYDPRRNKGMANLGGLEISFTESHNDPEVIVTITKHPYMKADAERMVRGLNGLMSVWGRTF